MNYFSKDNSGGSNASKGFEYQDYCALIFLFEYIDNEDFLSMTIETFDDFTIIFQDIEICFQVKKRSLSLSLIKRLLDKYNHTLNNNKKNVFIGTNFTNEVRNVILKRDILLNAINSCRPAWEKQQCQEDYKETLKKIRLYEYYNSLLETGFKDVNIRDIDVYLYGTLSIWLDKKDFNVQREELLHELLTHIAHLRSLRGELKRNEFLNIVEKYKIEARYKKVIKEIWDNEFKSTPDILKIIGDTKEEVLQPLENKLKEADEFIKCKKYSQALDIYLPLSKLFSKEDIYLHCAMIAELDNKFDIAISACDKILLNNPYKYEAYFIKGTSLGAINKHKCSIYNLKEALKIKKIPELYYNLGNAYLFNEETIRAIENYSNCLKLTPNNAAAHLNISICYFKNHEIQKSLIHVDEALELESEMYQAFAIKGELLRYMGIYDKAILYFEDCIELDTTNYQALYGISLSYIALGRVHEGIIYLTDWIKKYKERVFGNNNSFVIMDMGWKETIPIKIVLDNCKTLTIEFLNKKFIVDITHDEDFVFIGADQLSDDTGSILYPVIGKIFANEQDYIEVVTKIKLRVDLLQYLNTPIYVNFDNEISVTLKEKHRNVYMELKFDDYIISGFTDEGNKEGLYAFTDYFNEYGQFRIYIGNKESKSFIIIDCVKEIQFEK